MARTPSTMLDLGTPAPDFSLLEPATGATRSLADFATAKGLVVVFMCNHCPFVKHIAPELALTAMDFAERGIAVVGINSNDAASHPADAPERMAEEVAARGYHFPYLFDADQSVARAYRAACTPDFYLFDGARRLVYRGQFDGARPGNQVPVTGADLRFAVDALLADRPIREPQRPSLGCNIKWKPGHEPDYYG